MTGAKIIFILNFKPTYAYLIVLLNKNIDNELRYSYKNRKILS